MPKIIRVLIIIFLTNQIIASNKNDTKSLEKKEKPQIVITSPRPKNSELTPTPGAPRASTANMIALIQFFDQFSQNPNGYDSN